VAGWLSAYTAAVVANVGLVMAFALYSASLREQHCTGCGSDACTLECSRRRSGGCERTKPLYARMKQFFRSMYIFWDAMELGRQLDKDGGEENRSARSGRDPSAHCSVEGFDYCFNTAICTEWEIEEPPRQSLTAGLTASQK